MPISSTAVYSLEKKINIQRLVESRELNIYNEMSHLIRYILYETGHGKISLLKEIRHAENYIEMQKLRISNSRNISVSFTYEGNIMFAKIEPLLLIPFIENAFKHGLSYSQPCSITIDLHVNDEQLLFKAVNTKRMTKENISADTNCFGIGVANTKRRLELAYKGRYTLELKDAPDFVDYVKTKFTNVDLSKWETNKTTAQQNV